MKTIFEAKSYNTEVTIFYLEVREVFPNFGGLSNGLMVMGTPSWIVKHIDLDSGKETHTEYHIDDSRVLEVVARINVIESFKVYVDEV